MADRKVLVKYYPPDFDPEKLAIKGRQFQITTAKRRRPGGGKLLNVRFMFPFTMCCGMCNEFIYIGTKFNSRVEKIKDEDYLGTSIWRFHARCPHCRAEISFKTDPKNTEYVLESGGTRTYDPRKDADLAESTLKKYYEQEIATDTMKALEHKTNSTVGEIQALEQLDELRKLNKRFLCRESTLQEAMKWIQNGSLQQIDSKLDSAELTELQNAIDEIAKKRADRLLSDILDTSDNHTVPLKNSTILDINLTVVKDDKNSSTLLARQPAIYKKKRVNSVSLSSNLLDYNSDSEIN